LTRELAWFGYLVDDDIRDACRAGLDRDRFVYTAVYTEQVRAYDLSIDADGAGVLETSGLEDPPPLGVRLDSGDFW